MQKIFFHCCLNTFFETTPHAKLKTQSKRVHTKALLWLKFWLQFFLFCALLIFCQFSQLFKVVDYWTSLSIDYFLELAMSKTNKRVFIVFDLEKMCWLTWFVLSFPLTLEVQGSQSCLRYSRCFQMSWVTKSMWVMNPSPPQRLPK